MASKKAEIEGAEPMDADEPLQIEGASVDGEEPETADDADPTLDAEAIDDDAETLEDEPEPVRRSMTLRERKAYHNEHEADHAGTPAGLMTTPSRLEDIYGKHATPSEE